jgi:hypothetical protein
MELSLGGTPMPRLRIAQAVLALAAAVALSIGAAQPSFAGDADLACKRCGGEPRILSDPTADNTDVW